MRDILRRVRFSPYRKGNGVTFSLTMWDTHRRDPRGQTVIGYSLTMTADHVGERGRIVLFEGEDFAGRPMHADDSDATVHSLMTFLTLRPGDTDADYFKSYTPVQLDYCARHAESLSACVDGRFGER